jgi:hypothetical protein
MAQMYLPEHPHEREQLQSSVSTPDFTLDPALPGKQSKRRPLLQRIVHDLEQDADHTVSEEGYLSQLQEHFSEDEARAQLETVIDWGRYAELFSYVEERGIFRLEAPETQEEA